MPVLVDQVAEAARRRRPPAPTLDFGRDNRTARAPAPRRVSVA